MSDIIDAKFENGVLIPLKKLNIQEGEIVRIKIESIKKITKKFIKKLDELSTTKIENASKVFEEMRDDSC